LRPHLNTIVLTTFKQLGLSGPILKAVAELGFESATEIQEQSIPALLAHPRNFIGLAQTGTGKTAAFGLPLIEHLDANLPQTQALILAPTRELGKQIADQLQAFSKYTKGLRVLPVYGGAPIGKQIQALKKPIHIIIATPGRLLDLIKRRAVHLDQIEWVVLDEADEMLNMGFKEDLDKILSFTPAEKHTWLFSATMAKDIRQIVKKYMHDPLEVQVNADQEGNENIEHRYIIVDRRDKTEALTRFLDANADMRSLVFCRTRRDTQQLAEELSERGHAAAAIHGDLSQNQRDRVMSSFRKKAVNTLVATDVAARGIDVDDISHVFHHSLSDESAYYTHRSGRTARAGKEGVSIALVGQREKNRLLQLERTLSINFTPLNIPGADHVIKSRITQWAQDALTAKPKQTVPEEWLDYVNTLFAGLTKEELIAKLLALEMAQIQDRKNNRDLNADFQAGGGGGGRGSRGRGRGKGSSKRKKYGRSGRKNHGGKSSHYSKKSHRKGGRNKSNKG